MSWRPDEPGMPPEDDRFAMGYYILDEHGEPKRVSDVREWAKMFEDRKGRILARDELWGGVLVSTVFLGLDHNFSRFEEGHENDLPVLWESMVFGMPPHRNDQRRYTSRADALKGHAEMLAGVQRLRPAQPPHRKRGSPKPK